MQSKYLGRIPFARALDEQTAAFARIRAGDAGVVLGFESEPVVTMGLRARAEDILEQDWPSVNVDRGGRATLHNPGQLVIFPVCPLGARGSRAWVDVLVATTVEVANGVGHVLAWREDAPGLWAPGGKVVSIGLRVRQGVSTHGLSINVRNLLSDFRRIRTCGLRDAELAHLRTDLGLAELFARWSDVFARRVSVT